MNEGLYGFNAGKSVMAIADLLVSTTDATDSKMSTIGAFIDL